MRESRETILVVDDAESLRSDVCRILRGEGYTVVSASRGVEAHWCLERGMRVDLLLADLASPEADNYHLGIPLGLLHPHRPVIFTSPRNRYENIQRGLLDPRSPFLQKPFPPYLLTHLVRMVLDRWSPPQTM
jgi:two-component system cell cycle sensor histidine kinase/response regulator CckA